MKEYIGYIRVSTVKQGTKGVSLNEQRDAIVRYAERNNFPVKVWLEEMETAAKLGRPVFNKALKLLRTGKLQGIILHKLDRGARNLRDWAAIGELSDQGVEVHFVNESLDLQSRGGRLSADIQAVVAADYIRNLREETRKGFYGRLKQGLYPLRAPLGYADQGKGKAKTIHPVMGPLVRQAFELYGSGRYNFETLGDELYRLGLRNHNGGRVTKNGLSTLLNNSFYIGLIEIHKTGESFVGVHEPLVRKALFDRAQGILTGRVYARTQRHAFEFRRMLSCVTCGYSLIGERQKGHVYYRCHSKQCRGNTIQGKAIDAEVAKFFNQIRFSEEERAYFMPRVTKLRETWASRRDEELKSLNLRSDQIKDRLNRLTDAYLDQALDKAMFEERKKALFLDQKSIEGLLAEVNRNDIRQAERIENFLELAGNAWLSHRFTLPDETREMINISTSNRQVHEKKLDLKPSIAFHEIANRYTKMCCDPHRDIPRTWDRLLAILAQLNAQGLLPDLSAISGFQRKDTTGEISAKE